MGQPKKERLLTVNALISEVEKKLPILNKWDEVCNSLPKRVVHYDTKINNFLFDKKTEGNKTLLICKQAEEERAEQMKNRKLRSKAGKLGAKKRWSSESLKED